MKAAILPIAMVLMPLGAASAAPDKFGITAEEHAACDADAISLCADTYPNEDKLLACMRASRSRLSPECLSVFTVGMKRRHLPL